ncbi:hypothetical protein ACFYUV_11390 [Nonomuraea sp. NPDC003560]|uniref:hypothetical protein n=1 Tax=Nonomuraea sp. NPDC003560 TaxID=3364341 RepID=UPI0036B31B77
MAHSTRAPQRRRPADDQLMLLPEIAEYVRSTPAGLRYRRHTNDPSAPPIWRQGRRLVAWKSEIDQWLDEQRAADEQRRSA